MTEKPSKEGDVVQEKTEDSLDNNALILSQTFDQSENGDSPEDKTIDFSCQGLTVLPITLFNRIDVVYLNLSGNNLRGLPSDITRLKCLRRLDVSRNALRCTHVNDVTSLPLEMSEEMTKLEEVNISECNLMFIPATIWQMTSLLKLDISRNKLDQLPGDIGGMSKLRYLNAQQTGLSSVPGEIVCCERLQTLLLYGNPITSLPDTMRELARLTRLTLNAANFCTDIDEHVEGLLERGKIQSEHIPPVLFSIPKLKCINLENCKLNCLPDKMNQGLQRINISYNFFPKLPPALFTLTKLTEIEISNNLLSELPNEMINLVSLRRLVARSNKIVTICSAVSQLKQLICLNLGDNHIVDLPDHIGGLTNLEQLILDHNSISKLPETLCNMIGLHTLDLTSNKIKELPLDLYRLENISTAHKFKGLFRVGLWLHKNPIKAPPPNIWKCTNPEQIWTHLKKMKIREVKNMQPMKVLIIGNHDSGKSSLTRSLITGKSSVESSCEITLANSENDTSHLQRKPKYKIDDDENDEDIQQTYPRKHLNLNNNTLIYSRHVWKSENSVKFIFFDMGGHPVFETVMPRFLDPDALYILAFDASAYKDEGFNNQIGKWLKIIQQYAPRAVIKLVGLKRDLLFDHLQPMTTNDVIHQSDDDTGTHVSMNNDVEEVEMNDEVDPETQPEREMDIEDENHAEDDDETENDTNLEQMRIIESIESQLLNLISEDVSIFKKDFNSQIESCKDKMVQSDNDKSGDFEMQLQILPKITLLSTVEGLEGILDLRQELELLAVNGQLFPLNQRRIPPSYRELCKEIQQFKFKRNNFPNNEQHLTYLTKEEVNTCATEIGLARSGKVEIENALKYLHTTGQIFWFHRHPTLQRFVFYRMNRIPILFGCLLRDDLETYLDYSTNPIFNCKGKLSQEQFSECLAQFTNYGEISRPFLHCLAFHLKLSSDEFLHLQELFEIFLLGICLDLPPSARGSRLYNLPVLILPQFVTQPVSNEELNSRIWPIKGSFKFKEESSRLIFPLGIPIGIFESLTCRLHACVAYREDWEGLVFALIPKQNITLLLKQGYLGIHEYYIELIIRQTITEKSSFTKVTALIDWFQSEVKSFCAEAQGLIVYKG